MSTTDSILDIVFRVNGSNVRHLGHVGGLFPDRVAVRTLATGPTVHIGDEVQVMFRPTGTNKASGLASRVVKGTVCALTASRDLLRFELETADQWSAPVG